MARTVSVGIDIGSHNTRVAVIETVKGKTGFVVAGTGISKSIGVRHGYVINQEEASRGIREAVQAAEKSSGVKIRKALISIGGVSLESIIATGSHIISRIDGEVTQADVDRVIQACEENAHLSNKKVIHGFPLSFKLDGKEVLGRPEGMRGMKLLEAKVLFISSLDQHLDNLIRAVEGAGIEVEDVVAAPFAASLVTLTKAQRTAGCVLTNIGAETVSIVVFENDKPISLQVFPIGSTDITNDIALGLRISLEEAENIKKGVLTQKDVPQKKLDEIIEARLKDIFDLIEAHLKKINRNGLLPAGVILTGGGANLQVAEELAKVSLRLPARVTIPRILENQKDKTLDASWAVPYGLGILGFDDFYGSDLFQISRVRAKNHFDGAISWVKQFLP